MRRPCSVPPGKLTTVASVEAYPAEKSTWLVTRNSPSNSAPRERVRPRFWRWRVMSEGVVDTVTFSIGSTISLQKNVLRKLSLRFKANALRPASPPVNRSAIRFALLLVTTLPSLKPRYSSFKVGARNELYMEAVAEKLLPSDRKTESRGLKAMLLRSAKIVPV